MPSVPITWPFVSTAKSDLPRRIIISMSSDIGHALAQKWLAADLQVAGTYRTKSPAVDELEHSGAILVHCDLDDVDSIERAVAELRERTPSWDVLVLAAGVLDPIGPFVDCAFKSWAKSLDANFTAQFRTLHGLLPIRRHGSERGPIVLFFAGGGANSAPVNFTAYTVSKIASIKMVELLDAEVTDTRFTIIGPGWVKTKIHQATLSAQGEAGPVFAQTAQRFATNEWVPMERVIACCDRIIEAPRQAIGGRNISTGYDRWDDPQLYDILSADPNLYKLRRSGNETLTLQSDRIEALATAAKQLGEIVSALPEIPDRHAPGTAIYRTLATAAQSAAFQLFGPGQGGPHMLSPFGEIVFPYRSFGAVDTLALFGLDELIIAAFYWANRRRYKRVCDIGANIGWHSLLLSRCGFEVRSFEPDPVHVKWLRETLAVNAVSRVTVVEAAVSDQTGEAEFVRVLGNTTGSHLAGAKPNPYGDLQRFNVPTVSISELFEWADLVKIDAEGHEAKMLLALTSEQWRNVDAILEVGSEQNAHSIFAHCENLGLKIFSQKIGWSNASKADDLPFSYREGSAFITRRSLMPGMGQQQSAAARQR